MKKVVTVSIIGIGIILVFMVVMGFISKEGPFKNSASEPAGRFIVSNPVDLSQISTISKFRSCAGHDYSGINAEGQKEKLRSMKHYITQNEEFNNSKDKIKVYAPFDGEVSSIESDKGGDRAPRGVQLWLEPNEGGGWLFIYFHIEPLINLEGGSRVMAGDLVGYANVIDGANFDFGLKSFGFGGQKFGSPFNYMSDEVLTEYSAVGITPKDIVTTKEHRDANPCPIEAGTESKYDTFFQSGDRDEDWVRLVR